MKFLQSIFRTNKFETTTLTLDLSKRLKAIELIFHYLLPAINSPMIIKLVSMVRKVSAEGFLIDAEHLFQSQADLLKTSMVQFLRLRLGYPFSLELASQGLKDSPLEAMMTLDQWIVPTLFRGVNHLVTDYHHLPPMISPLVSHPTLSGCHRIGRIPQYHGVKLSHSPSTSRLAIFNERLKLGLQVQ